MTRSPILAVAPLLLLVLLAACDTTDPEDPDHPSLDRIAQLDRVTHVNKLIHHSHLGALQYATAYVPTVDLTLHFDTTFDVQSIRRVRIFNEQTDNIGLGWELRSAHLGALPRTETTLTLPNLVIPYDNAASRTDALFEVRIDWGSGAPLQVDTFLVKGTYPRPLYATSSWADSGTLDLILQTECCYPSVQPQSFDEGMIYWMDNQVVLDSVAFSDVNETVRLTDVPGDATAFHIAFSDVLNTVPVQLLTEHYAIPDRLPGRSTILQGIQLSQTSGTPTVLEQDGHFLAHSTTTDQLHVLDAAAHTVARTIPLRPFGPTMASGEGGDVYVAYSDGIVDAVDVASGAVERVGSFGTSIHQLGVAGPFLVARGALSNNDDGLLTMNLHTREVVEEQNYYPNGSEALLYNPAVERLYLIGYDLTSFAIDPTSGALSDQQSRYNGGSGGPHAVLFPDGSRLATGDGRIYRSSSNLEQDLVEAGKFLRAFAAMAFVPERDLIVSVGPPHQYGTGTGALTVYRYATREALHEVALPASPLALSATDEGVHVLMLHNASNATHLLLTTYPFETLQKTTQQRALVHFAPVKLAR